MQYTHSQRPTAADHRHPPQYVGQRLHLGEGPQEHHQQRPVNQDHGRQKQPQEAALIRQLLRIRQRGQRVLRRQIREETGQPRPPVTRGEADEAQVEEQSSSAKCQGQKAR